MVVDVVKRKLDRVMGMGSERMCKGWCSKSFRFKGFNRVKGSEGRGLLLLLFEYR